MFVMLFTTKLDFVASWHLMIKCVDFIESFVKAISSYISRIGGRSCNCYTLGLFNKHVITLHILYDWILT